MITELAITELNQYTTAFNGPHLAMIMESTLAGNTAAQLWMLPQPQAEPVLVLWEKGNNGLYVSALPVDSAVQQDLTRLFEETIRPRALSEGVGRFKLRIVDEYAEETLHTLFPDASLQLYGTRFYGFNDPKANPAPMPSIEGIHFARIEQTLLEQECLLHSDEVLDEVRGMWPSEERFYSNGFGYVAIVGSEIICWCTSEFVGPNRCGIGIATQPVYERRGVATATAARFVDHALQHGMLPYWECGSMNLGSQRVAEKVGFELLDEEKVWIGAFVG